MSDTSIPFFEAGPAVQSLRESEFDALSAYCEVIDNSLQADAATVKIRFDKDDKPGRSQIRAVAFGDDGSGMDHETLWRCLKIGWSSRFNDRSGIGRFGVGMTLGAIHECKRVELWSKTPGGDWLYTYLDLDEVEAGKLSSIPEPAPRKLPPEFATLPGAAHGTLVVWRKYDRQDDGADAIIEEFKHHVGRTFRHFIWDAIPPRRVPAVIEIQGEVTPAFDPLYARTEKTRFPNDPKAHQYKEMEIQWPVDWNAPNPEGRKSTIRIKMTRLPEEFWPHRGSGGSAVATARFIDQNAGISILRNHREVFFGEVPYWKLGPAGWPNFTDVDRWWGCEVLFTPEVDRAFQVKHIKRGAVPMRELKSTLKEKIRPTRETVLREVDAVWKKADLAKQAAERATKDADDLNRPGDHEGAEGTVKKAAVPKGQIDAGKDIDAEAKKAASDYGKRFDAEQKQRLAELFKNQPFTIMETDWRGPQFYESKFLGGTAVLDYNMGHVFWSTVYGLVAQLGKEGTDDVALAKDIRVMLDLLLIGHAKAESMFSPDAEMTADQFIQELRSYWGQFLASFVNARAKEVKS